MKGSATSSRQSTGQDSSWDAREEGQMMMYGSERNRLPVDKLSYWGSSVQKKLDHGGPVRSRAEAIITHTPRHVKRMRDACTTRREVYCQSSPLALLTVLPIGLCRGGERLLSLQSLFLKPTEWQPQRLSFWLTEPWCGPETNTKSNIHYLAKMIGINPTAANPTYTSPTGDVHAKYFYGVGLGGDFMSYLWDGAFGTHAERECTDVYEYIVQNFAPGREMDVRLSRGAYIVRSVAGMVNNCGIIRNSGNAASIRQVYRLYRSPYAVNEPSSPEMQQFRNTASHPVTTPIKFMGIFDTVGKSGHTKAELRYWSRICIA